jgi:hypothetical protein
MSPNPSGAGSATGTGRGFETAAGRVAATAGRAADADDADFTAAPAAIGTFTAPPHALHFSVRPAFFSSTV